MNARIEAIMERYRRLSAQQRDHLTEESTKTSFITPLLQALDWDTENPLEMTMEESVSGGRVDYAFRLHGVTRFYYARQVINYSFN